MLLNIPSDSPVTYIAWRLFKMYAKLICMFGNAQYSMRKTTKNAVLPLGMNLAKRGSMRNGLSIKQLTLAVGIVVALIVAFLLVSVGKDFSAESPVIKLPTLNVPSFAKVVTQKISKFY